MAKNRNTSVEAAIERRMRERTTGEGRYVDLAIDFVLIEEGAANDNRPPVELPVYASGGRWDRRLLEFDQDAASSLVVRMHPGQRRALEWFRSWIEAHKERRSAPPAMPNFDGEDIEIDSEPSRVYSALFAGGRRAGKTWIAVAIAVLYAITFPDSIVWIVSPNDGKHDEIRRYMLSTVAEQWLDRETAFEYDLINGSQIILKSGHDPDLLKEGKANLVILNEGQMMKPRTYTVARGAIVDQSGLVIVCANPPVGSKDHQWVTDFAAEAAAGRRAAVYVEFNPLLNPHIDRAALMSMSAELDERSFAIEVLGQFRGPKDAVAYNWVRLENEKPVDLSVYEDVTSQFLESIGEGPGITTIVGLDVQRIPYIGGPWYRFYVPRGTQPTVDNVCAWIVGETVLEGGDEVDFCAGLATSGLDPATTLIVCDATAEYQHSMRRLSDQAPPEWSGRGSFSIIRGEGYTKIVPPDRRMRRKNPAIADRIRAFNSMICSGQGVRRLFADPVKAPKTCAAIRDWRQKHGAPSRTQEVAHLGDGASYPMIRLFPRRLRAGPKSTNPRAVQDPVASRVDRVAPEPARFPSDQRIKPSSRGDRRGSRTRGL